MAAKANDTWRCCICALELHAFGTLACDDTCPNRKHAHLTGKWYLTTNERGEGQSVGIAAISDEKDGE